MLDIGSRITLLRKKNNWSQDDLAKEISASRAIIGKYERNENTPSIEMAVKLANIFGVSIDYLIGKGKYGNYDKEMIERFDSIENMDKDSKIFIFRVLDSLLRDIQAKKAYIK
jgi:transcriptional regulator with XRE-family HTH domain